MTKITQQKIAALRQARHLIEQGDAVSVCNAIRQSGASDYIVDTLCADVQSRVHPFQTVGGWLLDHVQEASEFQEKHPELWAGQLKEYRLRWVDAIIQEVEERQANKPQKYTFICRVPFGVRAGRYATVVRRVETTDLYAHLKTCDLEVSFIFEGWHDLVPCRKPHKSGGKKS